MVAFSPCRKMLGSIRRKRAQSLFFLILFFFNWIGLYLIIILNSFFGKKEEQLAIIKSLSSDKGKYINIFNFS
jgi:hypothetical protein